MSSPHRRSTDGKPKLPSPTLPGSSSEAAADENEASSLILNPNGSSQLKEETISSFSYFHFRIQSLVEKLKGLDSSEQIILMFTGSELPHSDQSWCKDCNYLEAILSKFMRRAKRLAGYLVRVKVGTRDEWQDFSNPYRNDPRIQLKVLPTLMVWNSGKRLSGAPIFQVDQLVAMFDEDIVVEPESDQFACKDSES